MTTDQVSTTNEAAGSKPKSAARYIPAIVRVLMGLAFVLFGLNGIKLFLPQPKDAMPEKAMAFAGALMNTGYMMPLVMWTMLLVGVLLLLNRFVPLALALIAPILVGIITFHIFLAPSSIVPGAVLLIMELYLAWAYRNAFRPMLAMRTTPGG
jgi:uncharacterized membrane protein YphA (DoxX/SURF4 family)